MVEPDFRAGDWVAFGPVNVLQEDDTMVSVVGEGPVEGSTSSGVLIRFGRDVVWIPAADIPGNVRKVRSGD